MRKERCLSDRLFRIITFTIMTIFAISFIGIFFWMIFGSMRSISGFVTDPFNFFDISWKSIAKNYERAFTYKVGGTTAMPEMFLNSILFIVGTVSIGLILTSISGYIVAKYTFALRKFIITINILVITIPTVGTVSITYRLLDSLNLLDTFFGVYLLAAGGFGFNFLLFYNYFSAIPWEYAESAFIDGAGNFTVMMKIMMPQALPIISAVAVVSFIGSWNDYYTPYMYLNSRPTVAYGINAIYQKYNASMPYVFAGMTFSAVVSLGLYCAFSKTIMESMSAGGLKG